MRIVNDKEAKPEPRESGVLEVLSYSLLCGVGTASVFFAPVAMILAHFRLPENPARFAGLLGAVIALVLFEAQVSAVAVAFVLSLYVADRVVREDDLWKILLGSVVVASGTALAILTFSAYRTGVSVPVFWSSLVSDLVGAEEFSKTVEYFFGAAQVPILKEFIRFQGPSVFMSAVLLSVWIAVGLSAHLKWTPATSSLSAAGLRASRLSKALPVAYAATFVAVFAIQPGWRWTVESVARILGSLVLIQGTVTLARLLELRNARNPVRTLIYLLGLSFGYYGVVGLGLLGPWFTPRAERTHFKRASAENQAV